MELIEYPDRELMMLALADRLASEIGGFLRQQDRVGLAVPGGSTPGPVFDALAGLHLDWDRVDVVLTDERWVPAGSARSNARLVRARLLVRQAAAARALGFLDAAPDRLPGQGQGQGRGRGPRSGPSSAPSSALGQRSASVWGPTAGQTAAAGGTQEIASAGDGSGAGSVGATTGGTAGATAGGTGGPVAGRQGRPGDLAGAVARSVPAGGDGAGPLGTPEAAAAWVAGQLAPALPLSVVLMGMGEDGHVASLFPRAEGFAAALARDAPPVAVLRPAGQPEPRLSLTAPVLGAAMAVHVVITGAAKRAALARAADLQVADAPVRLVLPDACVHWAP